MADEKDKGADATAFAEEVAGVAPVLTWRGRDYELEPGLPAIVVLEALRFAQANGENAEPPMEKCIALLEDVFTRERLDVILRETRTPLEDLGSLLLAACKAYGLELGAPAPNRAARRARPRAAGPSRS